MTGWSVEAGALPVAAARQPDLGGPDDRRWTGVWRPPGHAFAAGLVGGQAATVCLAAFEMAVDGLDLGAWLPAALARAVRRRQLSFLAGRLCAERCLRALGAAQTRVGRSPQGIPLWPDGVRGSITHTDAQAHAVAVWSGHWSGIGIDAEPVIRPWAEIAALCCTAHERRHWLSGCLGLDPGLATTLVFSVKEAFYKAVHPLIGRFVDFDEVEVCAWHPERDELRLRPLGHVSDLSAADGAVCRYAWRPGAAGEVRSVVLIARRGEESSPMRDPRIP